MSLSFGGLASGLPPNLVDIIIKSERKPIELIEENKSRQESRLALLGQLKTSVSSLNSTLSTMTSFSSLRELAARSSDESILSVTVDKERAKTGVYTLQVEQLAKKASAISRGFPDRDNTEVGIGYLVFDVEGEEKEIFIGEDNNTLDGIATAIEASGIPIRASIVHDEASGEDEQYRLILATDAEGADQEFNFPNFYFLDGDIDFYFENESESHNGRIVVDGFPVSVKSNKLKEIIPGATINLLDAHPKKNVSIIIEEDVMAVGDKVATFVEGTNKVLDFFESQFSVNETTDTSKTFAGDTSLQSLQYRIRRILQDTVPGLTGKVRRLTDVGITFNRSGKIEFDRKKFLAAANEDFKSVSDLFSENRIYENEDGDSVKAQGVATRLYTLFKDVIFGNGILAIKEQALRQRVKTLDGQIERKERHLENRKNMLKKQFATLETTMSKMNAQRAQMTGQLGGMAQQTPGMLAGKFAGL